MEEISYLFLLLDDSIKIFVTILNKSVTLFFIHIYISIRVYCNCLLRELTDYQYISQCALPASRRLTNQNADRVLYQLHLQC